MVNGKAKKFGGDRVSLDVIEKGEGRDEEIKVRALVVLESKVIYQRRCHERRDGRDREWWFV